jgi:hypothetical protein
MVTPAMRAIAQERARYGAALVDEHQRQLRMVGGITKTVLCVHDVVWTTCTICSKPKLSAP